MFGLAVARAAVGPPGPPLLPLFRLPTEFFMSPVVRRIVAVLVAFLAAAVFVMLGDWLSHKFFPTPGIDSTDMVQVEGATRAGLIPLKALIVMAAGWVVGAFVGGTVALKIGREGGRGATMIFAALFTIATIANLVMIPHPAWMWFVGVVAVPLAAIVAGRDRSAG